MMSRRSLLWSFVFAYAAVWLCIYAVDIRPHYEGIILRDQTDIGDAVQYNSLAVNLVQKGMYSLDGVTPFFEREPGYSAFLAAVYKVVGIDAYGIVFFLQGLLYLLAVLFFERTLRRLTSPNIALIATGFLLFMPTGFHVVFLLIRESLALSLGLIFCTATYEAWQRRSWGYAALAGASLGYLILTYAALLLVPIFLVAAFVLMRFPWKQAVLMFIVAGTVIAPWAIRNYSHKGELCLTGCYRAALQWYVRGEQAETIRGFEPARCLWAEYISRDYTGRDLNCNFNAVWHRKWPDGFYPTIEDRAIGRAGQEKILAHFGWYLWFSVFEVVELHLPYVDSWSTVYNVLAALWSVIVYVGCLLALPFLWRRWAALPAAFMLYFTAVFILTDATPRYLAPALFCYAAFAGVGYDRLLSRFSHVVRQHRHSGV